MSPGGRESCETPVAAKRGRQDACQILNTLGIHGIHEPLIMRGIWTGVGTARVQQ